MLVLPGNGMASIQPGHASPAFGSPRPDDGGSFTRAERVNHHPGPRNVPMAARYLSAERRDDDGRDAARGPDRLGRRQDSSLSRIAWDRVLVPRVCWVGILRGTA